MGNHKDNNASPHTKFKKSLLAVCVMALSAPSFAQNAVKSDEVEEVLVTTTRQNLQSAQETKRNASTFVDSISSEDIGSLPDRSVLEAMQRIPGISIERFAGVNDPDHFGVEGSGAVIRGMTATRSEFNGRDSFTANSGRGLSFQDVPPELMGGVDVYKNQSADMIEGGIGGTVSLRTRKPFDSKERVLAFSADATYGDMVKKTTPTISALYSDRWDTEAGEFGLLVNLAKSKLEASSHGIQTDRYEARAASSFAGAEAFTGNVLVPTGSNATMKIDERERNGYALAAQWESPDQTVLGTFQFMRSDATLTWNERAIKYQGGYNNNRAVPLEGTSWDFDENGVFESGVIADRVDGWRGDGDRIPHNASWSSPTVKDFGLAFQTDTRYKNTNTVVDDYGFNVKFNPSEKWEYSVDAQYIKAKTKDDDVDLFFGNYAMENYDISGNTPKLDIIDPWQWAVNKGVTSKWANNPDYFQSPTSYYWRSAMDHYERSEGDALAARFDATRFIEDNFFKSVKFGVRFSDREQHVRSTAYNWGMLAAPWAPPVYQRDAQGRIIYDGSNPKTIYAGGAAWLDSKRATDANLGGFDLVDWSDFFRGGVMSVPGASQPNVLLHPQLSLVKEYAKFASTLANVNSDWDPANIRDVDNDGTIDTVDGSYFTPWEINTVEEKNKSAYVRVDFGSDDYALRFDGNFGLRYVKIDREIEGFTVFPNTISKYPVPAWFNDAERARLIAEGVNYKLPAGHEQDDPRFLGDYINFITPQEKAFSNNHYIANNASPSEDHFLPSFNLKVQLTDDVIGRFAVSKAIALPDIGDLRSQTKLSIYQAQSPDDLRYGGQDSKPGEMRLLDITKIKPIKWQSEAGNPYLKSMESTQWDASLEWYFAKVGSLTGSIFYKDLSNFFVKDLQTVSYTNPSTNATSDVLQTQTRNVGSGEMKGVEIAYQQFFDMLPAPFDGIGVQANYSYIEASGIPSYDAGGVAYDVKSLPLQGQSKKTYNFALMYEKYDWSLRAAYNWRSKYLLTTRDVITGLPIYNDDAGFLDASAFYNINEHFKVGMQFTNLLDTQTRTFMQVDAGGTQLGRSWFVNDRRATFVLRGTF